MNSVHYINVPTFYITQENTIRTYEIEWRDAKIDPSKVDEVQVVLQTQFAFMDDSGEMRWNGLGGFNPLSAENGKRRFVYTVRFNDSTEFTPGKTYPVSNLGIRTDYWISGEYRYRCIAIKRFEDVPDPESILYCRSKMDVANPNLALNDNFTGENKNDFADIDIVSVEVADNRYIRKGVRMTLSEEGLELVNNQLPYWCAIDTKIEPFIFNKTYTLSFYARSTDGLTRSILPQYFGTDSSWGAIIKDGSSKLPVNSTEFKRYVVTFVNDDPIAIGFRLVWNASWAKDDEYIVGEGIEICGIKLEEGDECTAWIPHVASTLELAPSEENKITFNLLE